MTNFLLYKLKQFWIRRYMWRWCFDWWFIVMYPHIKYGKRWVYDKLDEEDNAYWFWEGLNNYDNVFDE